jgi:YVTN family beta-propeller protein
VWSRTGYRRWQRCRATAFVPNLGSDAVSTIDVKTRTKDPTDITVGTEPGKVAFTLCHR